MLLQTALEGITIGEHGMPSYTTTDFSCHVFIHSSEGRDVAYMLGLQRRIRHLQLRVQFVQHLIEVGQLTLDWIKGDRNPVDALTLENLRACVGLKAMQPGNPTASSSCTTSSQRIKCSTRALKSVSHWKEKPMGGAALSFLG